MKKRYSLKYVSNRVLFLLGLLMLLLLLLSGEQLVLLLLGRTPLLKCLLFFSITLITVFVSWFWIIRPYERSERLVRRFLEGHIISDHHVFEAAVLTPQTRQELEAMDRIMKSPQVMDLNKRQAQYLALQNQINPHFLYNTLESIRGEALIAGLDGVADMTEALAKFFRYTITKVENLVTVEEELDNCETYFQIQQYRFGERLKLHIEYDEEDREEIMNCKLPKLTLQPMLENCIIHGTEQKIGTGNLKIRFESTGERLLIRVSDDGVGMDEATLARLNRKLGRDGSNLYEDEKNQGGIALVNVNNRIHLIFGEEYGMHVYSIPNQGTDVEITIPLSLREHGSRGILP